MKYEPIHKPPPRPDAVAGPAVIAQALLALFVYAVVAAALIATAVWVI